MEMKLKPFEHQLKVWQESRDMKSFAVFWEQGTGKSKLAIDTICYRYLQGDIDAALILAPNGVHLNWETDEIPTHLVDEVRKASKTFCWIGKDKNKKSHLHATKQLLEHKGLSWLFMSYDAFMTDAGKQYAWNFLKKRKVFYILDESAAIKTPGAKRTRAVVASGKYAPYKRIMDGTPVCQGPFDAYSQMKFIDENFWKRYGIDTFAAFKAEFGVFRKCMLSTGGQFDQLLSYRNLDKLYEMIKPYSSRVLKEEVLDLPEKLYTKRYFELTPEQRDVYEKLREEQLAILEQGTVMAQLVITMQLRLQQVTSGYVPLTPEFDEDGEEIEPVFHEFAKNPRLDLLAEVTENPPHKQIIWAKYSRDIDKICDMLGKKAVRYDGKISGEEAARNKLEFQKGDALYFVANPAKGGTGLTLNQAKTSIYYNNSHNLRHRLQSEDRNHRIGQDEGVLYIDLVAHNTIDEPIIKNLVRKYGVASIITGDKLKEWLK